MEVFDGAAPNLQVYLFRQEVLNRFPVEPSIGLGPEPLRQDDAWSSRLREVVQARAFSAFHRA